MQVIKYKWENFEPFLIVNPGLKKIRLFNAEINAIVGEKRCTGFFLDGRHVECSVKLDYGSQCNSCLLRDKFSMCFRCTGERCINEKRRDDCVDEQYFIYLAAFNSILKVGISLDRRFHERLVEQGADFGAIVGRVKDGLVVRQIEQQIAVALGITDRVRGDEKKRMLFCDPNIAMTNIKGAITKLKQDFPQYLVSPQIFDMRAYYRLHNVYADPKAVPIENDTELKGNVIAAKGNILIIENGGFSAVNVHELLGREIEFDKDGAGPKDNSIQHSLAQF